MKKSAIKKGRLILSVCLSVCLEYTAEHHTVSTSCTHKNGHISSLKTRFSDTAFYAVSREPDTVMIIKAIYNYSIGTGGKKQPFSASSSAHLILADFAGREYNILIKVMT